jgi:hypothetical protein
MKTLLAFVGAIACGAAIALLTPPSAPARATDTCLRDAAGYATYNGGLTWNTEFFLRVAWINESDWSGDGDYYARRYDANFNLTFQRIVYTPGWSVSTSYVTSSNVYRRTTIATASTRGIPHWGVLEYGIC